MQPVSVKNPASAVQRSYDEAKDTEHNPLTLMIKKTEDLVQQQQKKWLCTCLSVELMDSLTLWASCKKCREELSFISHPCTGKNLELNVL